MTPKNKLGLFFVTLIVLNSVQAAPDSLKDAFAGKFKVGTSVSPNEFSVGSDFIKKHFNSITPENEMKPDSILDQNASKSKGEASVSFRQGTQTTLKFCEDNGIPMRGHTFVWHGQTPDWFFNANFDNNGNKVGKDEMNKRMESFIKNTFDLLASSYPNLEVYAYDVCNEVFQGGGGGLRPAGESRWMAIYGSDEYIVNAFTYARKYAPSGCKLFINDFNEYMSAKTNDIFNEATKLKGLGIIDGIGMQSHVGTNFPSFSDYQKAFEKFITSGLDVQITELDCVSSDENAQAQYYKNIFNLALTHSDNISALTVWGTNDSISWIQGETPLIFGPGYTPKKAYYAIMELVQ